MMTKTKASAQILKSAAAAGALLVSATLVQPVQAASAPEIPRIEWSFDGPTGQFDRAQLQRGFQIYQNVCSGCHGLSRLAWRNLVQPGGPEFPEEAVKELAKGWPNKIIDGPNDAGEMFERDALLSDPILGPYRNEKAARAAQNGAYPPDLSLIARARNPEFHGSVFAHGPHMLRDILTGYQAGGPNYLHALLTGYTDVPSYIREENGHLKPVGPEGAEGKTVEQCASITHGEDGKPDVCNPLAEGMNYNRDAGDPCRRFGRLSQGQQWRGAGSDHGRPVCARRVGFSCLGGRSASQPAQGDRLAGPPVPAGDDGSAVSRQEADLVAHRTLML
jgi:cytochrome c1